MTEHTITMLSVGKSEVPGPEVFWMRRWDEWLPLDFQVAVIRSETSVVLVNTGPPRDLAPLNGVWETFLGPRSAMTATDEDFILSRLREIGISPDDVTHVILTPFQLYTVSNVGLFRNAEICIAKRGWLHFHSTHAHPHDDRWTSLPKDVLSELVFDSWDRVRLLEDEDEIVPGVSTWWAGGHHRATIAVEVSTPRGTAVISDAFFYLENVLEDHPIGISENIYESLAAYERARGAEVILPLYDPSNFIRYPGGRIA